MMIGVQRVGRSFSLLGAVTSLGSQPPSRTVSDQLGSTFFCWCKLVRENSARPRCLKWICTEFNASALSTWKAEIVSGKRSCATVRQSGECMCSRRGEHVHVVGRFLLWSHPPYSSSLCREIPNAASAWQCKLLAAVFASCALVRVRPTRLGHMQDRRPPWRFLLAPYEGEA